MNMLSLAIGSATSFWPLGRASKRAAQAAYRELSKYDDHMLSDIGLTRRCLEDLRRGR